MVRLWGEPGSEADYGLGPIGGDALGLVTMVGLVTIMFSTCMILYSGLLAAASAPQ